ncbi:MAG: ribose-phosphate pyrophosphokinase [Alphaproteobacteria bacterium 64-11]|nr:ribose-phosphate pyrophosphokinase [Alphaproteobacteria bacterium]OJU08558.1 MAG: ribose-phosphate pyrophosphokinase [Alphaproteobacteria bacterium 64-11]
MTHEGSLRLFALDGVAGLGRKVAESLGVTPAEHEMRLFEDGEYKVRPLDHVDGCDVYLLDSLRGTGGESVHDRLFRLLVLAGAVRDGGAARITIVAPYLCYARKDRRTKLHDPLTLRYVATLFEAVGTDVMMVLDVHNPAAFENAFRCRTVPLTAAGLFAPLVRSVAGQALCVVSPDPGGVKRAELFRQRLEALCGQPVAKGFVDKRRSAGVLTGDLFAGDAKGATALIIDDLISTGHTMVRAAEAVRKAGAHHVTALASHGLFNLAALSVLADPAIDRLMVTDSVLLPPLPDALRAKTEVVSCAGLIAEAIRRLDTRSCLQELLAL